MDPVELLARVEDALPCWTPSEFPHELLHDLAAYLRGQIEVRDLVAKLYCASGCSCCRDDDAWDAASKALGALLDIPKYEDRSGWDWYSVRDAISQGAHKQ